ncbi:nucleic acid-binding [Striga asiatica]|uniref:Nucleic acid-binding n=1 Tax=Striga asiatica TaxID=4170 RepID=A0A5A7QWY9_STRAF|nr:nucleic acid-binding [Striga asiatica]
MNKTEWNIKGNRVERTSKVCPKSTYKKEASSIKKFHMELFRRHLKEGNVIAIRDFIVSPNGGRYKITIGMDKIAFHGRTRVLRVSKDRFPKFLYNFTSFSQLAKGTFFDPMLIDTTFIHSRNKLSCTLWEEKVDEIMPSILNRDIEPLVVILQFCRAKVVGVKVSNTSDITKLIVDQSTDEIKDIVAALWEEKVDEVMPPILNRDIESLVVILQFCRAKVVRASVKVSNTFDITKLIVEIKEFVAALAVIGSARSLSRSLVTTAVGKNGTFLIESQESDLMSKMVHAEAEKELDYGVDENNEENKYEDENEVNSPDKELNDKKDATPLKYYCKRKLFGESSSTTQKQKVKLHDAKKSVEGENEVQGKSVQGENEVFYEENAYIEDV